MKSSKPEKKTEPFSDEDLFFYNFDTMTGFVVRNGPTPETQAGAKLWHFFSDLFALGDDRVAELFEKYGIEEAAIVRKGQGNETTD